MSHNDKWSMFKNYMHNELQISKDDIRLWIKEAVAREAQNLASEAFGKFDTKDIVSKIVFDTNHWGSPRLREDIRNELVKRVIDKMNISFIK